jgi:putative N6-adenine-specific DNA methylase
MKRFFVGCNIHFESELEKELREFWPYLIEADGRPHAHALNILEVVPGGVFLEAPLITGLQINFFSKLANRVLLRMKEFKAKDFPKVFQMLEALKKDPLLQNFKFSYQVAASESRLNNEKRLKEILEKVFGPEDKNSKQSLFLRMHQDLCTVSLDTTGLHLHKRSERTEQGAAPLRETLAAFCARKLLGDTSLKEIQNVSLIDPMCGTGTLLREASGLFALSLREDFAFLRWPQTPKILKAAQLRSNYPPFPFLFKKLYAFDLDSASVQRASKSLEALEVSFEACHEDLFQAQTKNLSPCWVISNPPYGERLKASFTPVELLTQIDKIYSPERVGLVVSERQAQSLLQGLDMPFKLQNREAFQNGGISVQFLVFSRV